MKKESKIIEKCKESIFLYLGISDITENDLEFVNQSIHYIGIHKLDNDFDYWIVETISYFKKLKKKYGKY